MTKLCSSLRRMTRFSAIVPLAAIVLTASAASAQSPLGSAESFAALAGTAVTCTNSAVTGDVGVWPGTAVTQTVCPVVGTVHAGDGVAQEAFLDFISAYNNLRDNPPTCDLTLTGTLAGASAFAWRLLCRPQWRHDGHVDARRPKATRMLSGPFLVDGALTGTNFSVVMINGGRSPCNVDWWVRAAATMTTSNFLGTILAGAASTVTGGTFNGHALATAGRDI